MRSIAVPRLFGLERMDHAIDPEGTVLARAHFVVETFSLEAGHVFWSLQWCHGTRPTLHPLPLTCFTRTYCCSALLIVRLVNICREPDRGAFHYSLPNSPGLAARGWRPCAKAQCLSAPITPQNQTGTCA